MGGPTRRPIPERQYFKIGEVASIVGVSTSAIRFYQREFWPHVRPARTGSGHHVYSRRDVMILGMIRTLVRDQQYTVKGARTRLGDLLSSHDGDPSTIDLGQGELPLGGHEAEKGVGIEGDQVGGPDTATRNDPTLRSTTAERDLERCRGEWEARLRRIRQAVNELLQEVDG
ncbi:MAG: MerR family transcriptional regulator [Deltaproteobacteria bacterium]|nr:MerR family transcriptional regulator [Deltaproteobacteria bacterium]